MAEGRSLTWTERGYPLEETGPKVLLGGNGPNRGRPGYAWRALLKALGSVTSTTEPFQFDFGKPFPMIFEELYLHGARTSGVTEAQLKSLTAKHIGQIAPGAAHQRAVGLKFNHILTTNYDLALEEAVGGKNGTPKNEAPVKETRYSIFRRNVVDERVIWHLHGDYREHGTINLGYEHYGSFLGQIRAYVTIGVTYQSTRLPSLMKRLANGGDLAVHSWIDFFFTRDVFIVGLELDVQEIHLWWLLTYRARRLLDKQNKIRGDVHYIYAKRPEQIDRSEPQRSEKEVKAQRKFELLKAAGIKTIPITLDSEDPEAWEDFYLRALTHANNA